MKRLALIVVILSGTAPAQADECIAIDNDLDRLACYDKEHGRIPKVEQITAPAGQWLVETKTSKLTDQTNVYLGLSSDETINCGWNRGDKITLVIRCHENTTSLYFNTGCHMTSSEYDDYGTVRYRLDDDKARSFKGGASTNNRSLGLWSGGRSIPVIKSMFGKKQMVVQMTPFSENPFTATFNIAGLQEAAGPLREACDW